MADTQIAEYVRTSLEGGYSVEQVRAALGEQGWGLEEVDEAVRRAEEAIEQRLAAPRMPPVPPKKREQNDTPRGISASQILLYLGGFIIVLAGILYVGINWSQWGAAGRITAILAPTLICYAAGLSLFFSAEHRKQGIVFLISGALLLPFLLSVTFKELAIFAEPFDEGFFFTVFAVSYAVYYGSGFVFRHPVWSFLHHGTCLLCYYFFLELLDVAGIFGDAGMWWLFLIPGTAYLLMSLWHDSRGRRDEGRYAYLFGALTLLLSFLGLLEEVFSNDVGYTTYLVIIGGAVVFLLGSLYERTKFEYREALYVIGVGVVSFSLARLTDGGALGALVGAADWYSESMVGWSALIIGVVYLGLGWGIGKLKGVQLIEAPKYGEFFNAIGPIWVLGGVLSLGLGGSKPIYETLLLATSLGFIFGSVPAQSRTFLYSGTAFLVVYIFSTRFEYFENSVGWPIALFIAGLASKGIGVAIERMKRRYFSTPAV